MIMVLGQHFFAFGIAVRIFLLRVLQRSICDGVWHVSRVLGRWSGGRTWRIGCQGSRGSRDPESLPRRTRSDGKKDGAWSVARRYGISLPGPVCCANRSWRERKHIGPAVRVRLPEDGSDNGNGCADGNRAWERRERYIRRSQWRPESWTREERTEPKCLFFHHSQ